MRERRDVTGDCGVEVLPVAPVVFEGLDRVGKELVTGVRDRWVGEKSGRKEIIESSFTSG